MYSSLFRELLTYMRRTRATSPLARISVHGENVERIGDHATKSPRRSTFSSMARRDPGATERDNSKNQAVAPPLGGKADRLEALVSLSRRGRPRPMLRYNSRRMLRCCAGVDGEEA